MTATKAKRINARLPPDVARKVAYLAKRLQKSTTQIVLESIERYFEAVNDVAQTPYERMKRSGFIGGGTGPRDLSTTYKSDYTRLLEEKHGVKHGGKR